MGPAPALCSEIVESEEYFWLFGTAGERVGPLPRVRCPDIVDIR